MLERCFPTEVLCGVSNQITWMFQWNIFAYLYEGEYFCRNNANYKKTLVNLQQNVDGRSHWEVIRHLSVWNEFYYQAASAEICLEVQITLEEFLLCKYELTFFNYYFLNSNEDLPHFFFLILPLSLSIDV